MTTRPHWMLYGATGYTGRRIAERAVALGARPLLAGRNAAEGQALAQSLGLPWRTIDLQDTATLQREVAQCSAVLHAAGPFVHTWQPMAAACLAGGTHYLDITGEIPVYEGLAALDTPARAAHVMLLPGCGFDVVPTDCLAVQLKRRLPDATQLDIAISFNGTLTRGTIRSALAAADPQAQVRRNHLLQRLPKPRATQFDFGQGDGPTTVYAVTFGDLSMAWRSTGIPNIATWLRPTPEFASLATLTDLAQVDARPAGPTADELAHLPSVFIAQARNAGGVSKALRLVTPQVYALTFDVAATLAERVHQGTARHGFQTPANVFGEDCILSFDGCTMEDWPAAPMDSA